MGYTESSGYCGHCANYVRVRRPAPSHLLHFIITVFTCSLWLIPWVLVSIRAGGWTCAACGRSAARRLDAIGIAARAGLVALALFVVFAVGMVAYILNRSGANIPVNPSTVQPVASPEKPDDLAEYRQHIGKTAFNKSNGQEQGRIEGVDWVTLKGEGRVIAYKIRHKGRLRDSPVDNVEARDVPSTVANASKR